ncbi:MAG: hypothetical protein R3C97_14190 [Geminicoccaceae bacterium]
MDPAKTAAFAALSLLALAARAEAAGDGTAFLDALRDALGPGVRLSHGDVIDDPSTGDGTIRDLSLNRGPVEIGIGELRVADLVLADDGTMSTIGRLFVENVDITTQADTRLTFHDIAIEDLDIATLARLIESGMAREIAGTLDLGAVAARGIALRIGDLATTMDRLDSGGIVDGRLQQLELHRVMVQDAGSGGRASLRQIEANGVSLERLAHHMALVDGREAKFDPDSYRDSVFSELPLSVLASDLEISGPDGGLTLERLVFESERSGANEVLASFDAGPLRIDTPGSATQLLPLPQGPVNMTLSGRSRTDMQTFLSTGEVELDADGMAALDIAFSGTALEFVDAQASGLPPSTLARLVIDYEDRGLAAAGIDGMAEAMGMDRNGLAFQAGTFARMMFPSGAPPHVGDALRTLEDFIARPERLVISVNPSKPVPLDGMQNEEYQLDELAPLLDRWGVEFSTRPPN